MPLQEDYQVNVTAFCGPLDLLLFLIRRAEVDIHDIPIAEITDQYLEFLGRLDDIDVEIAGEFLVMAATLIELKSRTLMSALPAGARTGGEEPPESAVEDPRHELVQQLLAYQRYRIAAEGLEMRRADFSNRFPRRPAPLGRVLDAAPPDLELEDVHLLDLYHAYERIMSSIDFSRLGDHMVEMDDTPIALYQEDLLDRLHRATARRLTLQDAFAGHGRGERIGLFLATLELVRLRQVTVQQPALDSPIELVLNEDPEEERD